MMLNNDISLFQPHDRAVNASLKFAFDTPKSTFVSSNGIPRPRYNGDRVAIKPLNQLTLPLALNSFYASAQKEKALLSAEEKESLITEIIIPLSSGNQNDIVLPMLAHLSQQVENRWFTWITCSKLTTKELCKYNFAQEKVRIIRASTEEEAHWLMWDALNNGTSATVVSDIGKISGEVRDYLNQAAQSGMSRAVLLSELHS